MPTCSQSGAMMVVFLEGGSPQTSPHRRRPVSGACGFKSPMCIYLASHQLRNGLRFATHLSLCPILAEECYHHAFIQFTICADCVLTLLYSTICSLEIVQIFEYGAAWRAIRSHWLAAAQFTARWVRAARFASQARLASWMP